MQMARILFCSSFCIQNIVSDANQGSNTFNFTILRTLVQSHDLLDSHRKIIDFLRHRLLKDRFAIFALKNVSIHEKSSLKRPHPGILGPRCGSC